VSHAQKSKCLTRKGHCVETIETVTIYNIFNNSQNQKIFYRKIFLLSLSRAQRLDFRRWCSVFQFLHFFTGKSKTTSICY